MPVELIEQELRRETGIFSACLLPSFL